mmetsp:Transcript_8270/g.12463  ORF Transcript_8270/g.12463 Transcript_8270/m.12463 type:complete len:83 (-) Transcript_8270:714-962(-)
MVRDHISSSNGPKYLGKHSNSPFGTISRVSAALTSIAGCENALSKIIWESDHFKSLCIDSNTYHVSDLEAIVNSLANQGGPF